MQLDTQTVAIVIAAVTFTVDRSIALVKAAREYSSGGTKCSVAHDNMCKVIERLASLQEKEIEILHTLSTAAEITKLMLQDRNGDRRSRSLSPLTVELIRGLEARRDDLSSARQEMSDPPPSREKPKK